MDLESMAGTPGAENVLGRWHCDAALWSAFRAAEAKVYARSVRAARHFVYGSIVITALVLGLLSLKPIFGYSTWRNILVGPWVAVLIIGIIFAFVGVLLVLLRMQKDRAFNTPTGEVVITLDGVSTNGVNFRWNFDKSSPRFKTCKRETVDGFERIVFETAGLIPARGTPTVETFYSRVPVPAASVVDADRIIQYLELRIDAANDEWARSQSEGGHHFLSGRCRRCDISAERLILKGSAICRG